MTAVAQLPTNLNANPRLSRWLRFDAAGFVVLSPGKIEIGQGIITALAQIAADELDVDLARVRMIPATPAASPNEGVTAGARRLALYQRALRSRAGPRNLSGCRRAAPRRRRRESWGAGRHHRRPRQLANQLLGAGRRRPSCARCQSWGDAQDTRFAAGRWYASGTARPTRQGVRPAALRARSRVARPAARPRAEAGIAGGQADLARRIGCTRDCRYHRRSSRRSMPTRRSRSTSRRATTPASGRKCRVRRP